MGFAGEPDDLVGRQGHAEEHVGVADIERRVGERERIAHVADNGADRTRDAGQGGLLGDLGEARLREVERGHDQARGGELDRVPALARSEFEEVACARRQEPRERDAADDARLGAKEV